MTKDEALIRRFCAFLGEDPDAFMGCGTRYLHENAFRMEAAVEALDTFGMGIAEKWRTLSQATSDPNQLSLFPPSNIENIKDFQTAA